ncbi:MAG: acyl-CoA/acyl-ACP dehydrogenase [Helicobacteraceae bacterium]|jgi:alkylation response protein AidB-like acyl-CoA dehydrogenase|nr:acyl-CoA/acyl-ACP dehydrogenase [Helicobacteraceae bacterium]
MSRYEEVRELAKKSVAPHTNAADKEGRFPKESFEALREAGYFGLMIPKEFGGSGGTLSDHAEVCMALAESCATTALCYMMHNVASYSIVASGSDEMKKEKLPAIAQGKKVMALAFSESGSGTHFYLPELSAKKEGEKIVLNGRKSFVTTARFADEYLVDANAIGAEGLDIWSVPSEAKGIVFEDAQWDGLGMRGNNSMPMRLENVTLSDRDRVGKAGEGSAILSNIIAPYFVTGLAAVYSGVASAAQDVAIEYAKTRKYPDGSTLSVIPTVQEHLAKIYRLTQSARHYTFAAAKNGTQNAPNAAADMFAARINASENAVEVCRLAMKIGGGNAYAKRLPLERYLRDSYAAAVMAPSTDVLAIWLAQALIAEG